MRISIEEVLDFIKCPVMHKFKYIDKIDARHTLIQKRPNNMAMIDAYDKALHQTIHSLFYSLQDGVYPGLNIVAKRWGYLWVKPRTEQEDIRFKLTSWRDMHEKKRVEGWKALQKLWEHYRDPVDHPISVGHRYAVPIGNHILEGTIDLVQVVKNEQGREYIRLTEFVTDDRFAPYLHIRRDWQVTAASYAFRKLMNVNEEEIVYHGIISGKVNSTKRTSEDYDQLIHLLDSIERAKETSVCYPVFDKRCLTCPYEKHCEKGWYHAKVSE